MRELVRFDPEAEASRLRIWDRIDNDLVERDAAPRWCRYRPLPDSWRSRHAAHRSRRERMEADAKRIRELEAELARRG